MKALITTSAVVASVGLLLSGPTGLAKAHEEENISSSSVPAAVQKAAEKAAKGANIVRWEKEGKHYEAVIMENGKEVGIAISPRGKVLSRHDEASEKEKGEHH